jgi:plasmid replication initiation protein
VAWKDHELIMSEAKFHTDYNLKSDLKVVLYIKARYDDIFGKEYFFGGQKRKLTEGWIVTNTKFSSTAIQYGQCHPAIRYVGWNYPYDYNLHQMIEKHELIPVTALTTITTAEKRLFIEKV